MYVYKYQCLLKWWYDGVPSPFSLVSPPFNNEIHVYTD